MGKIDPSAIDPNLSVAGVQHFASVTSTTKVQANSINRYYDGAQNQTIIPADINGNATPELEIHLTGKIALH